MIEKIRNRRFNPFNFVMTFLSIIIILITVYPFYFVLIASISDPAAVSAGKVIFFPSDINFMGYKYIFEEPKIWLGYTNTIFYTAGSVILGVLVTTTAGYALSRKDLVGGALLMKLMVFTMFFSGGLIPIYMVVRGLNLINTRYVLIILGSVSVFNIILARAYYQTTLPKELFEAATIDGCGNFNFFIKIVLPLSKAIIAVIALYVAVWQWNSYFNALIFTTSRKLHPLQIVLRDFLIIGQMLTRTATMGTVDPAELAERMRIAEMIKYGIILASSVPILLFYPFLQRYFVQGIMIGSIKG
jgi:putative aldouronate transport system permease protein